MTTVEPLALKRRGGLTKSKKKKKLKKAPVAPPPQVPLSWSLSPEEHMARLEGRREAAVEQRLADGDFFSRTDFLDAKRRGQCTNLTRHDAIDATRLTV